MSIRTFTHDYCTGSCFLIGLVLTTVLTRSEPVAAKITAIQPRVEGGVELSSTVTPGSVYALMFSHNLRNWSEYSLKHSWGTTLKFQDPSAALKPARFYWVRELPRVENDAFEGRTALLGSSLLVTGDVSSATLELGEPMHGLGTLWWKWTAPETGRYAIAKVMGHSSIHVSVFQGDAIGSLSLLTRFSEQDVVDVQAGWELQIAVTSTAELRRYVEPPPIPPPPIVTTAQRQSPDLPPPAPSPGAGSVISTALEMGPIHTAPLSPAGGGFKLSIQKLEPLHNDHIVGSEYLFSSELLLAGDLRWATREPREFQAASDDGPSLWWKWRAPTAGRYILWNEQGFADLRIRIWDTSGNLVVAAGLGEELASASFDAFAEMEYRIQVVRSLVSRTIQLEGIRAFVTWAEQSRNEWRGFRIKLAPLDVNDSFEKRILLSGEDVLMRGNTRWATRETGEPESAGAGKTLWWSWVAPTNGVAVVTTVLHDVNTSTAVFTGDALENLTPVESMNGAFVATAGVTYHIQIDTIAPRLAEVRLRILDSSQKGIFAFTTMTFNYDENSTYAQSQMIVSFTSEHEFVLTNLLDTHGQYTTVAAGPAIVLTLVFLSGFEGVTDVMYLTWHSELSGAFSGVTSQSGGVERAISGTFTMRP